MKILVGTDLGNYTFNPTLNTITFSDMPDISLEQILVITHVETGTIIYNFADSSKTGSITNNVLTLNPSVSGLNLSNTALQIWVQCAVNDSIGTKDLTYSESLLTKVTTKNKNGIPISETNLTYLNGVLTSVETKALSGAI